MIVVTDSRDVVPQFSRAASELASSNTVQITVPALATGSPISDAIASDQDLYYQINLAAGQTVEISVGYAAFRGGEFYVAYQTIPTTSSLFASSNEPSAPPAGSTQCCPKGS